MKVFEDNPEVQVINSIDYYHMKVFEEYLEVLVKMLIY
jgi:hypothetical protein